MLDADIDERGHQPSQHADPEHHEPARNLDLLQLLFGIVKNKIKIEFTMYSQHFLQLLFGGWGKNETEKKSGSS